MDFNGIDGIDRQIVGLLRRDGRMSYTEVGEAVGLSRTAVRSRIEALERSGVIKGYAAVVDEKAFGDGMSFIINIETRPESFEACKKALAAAEETVTLVQTTGKCRLYAVCLSDDVARVRDLVNRVYSQVPGIVSIHANSVIDVIKGSVVPN